MLAGLERRAIRERRREDLTPRAWLFALAAVGLLTPGISEERPGPRRARARGPLRHRTSTAALDRRPSPAPRRYRGSGGGIFPGSGHAAGARHRALQCRTAALSARQFAAARQWLGQAALSLDPELRYRALYNLGLTDLIESRADTAKRAELEEQAAKNFRDALLLSPRSASAKWNLELVQQRTPPPSGGGGSTPPPTPPARAPPTPSPRGSGALSQAEAEQILNSVDRTERDVRADQMRRRRVAQSSAGKDW